MTQILSNNKQGLVFEIVSARIYDEGDQKKHVIYTLQVRHISGNDDLSPSVIERRYTHFLNLYDALKKEHPQLMANVPFPKKVFMGNFDNELISTRSTGFETLFSHISSESVLRTSYALISFLQDVELQRAKELLAKKDYMEALPLLENGFKLLNKVFTDRSPAVLLALCRLLGCSTSLPNNNLAHAQRWADLALHRYDGVSDGDLLELYVPLLQTCVRVWRESDKDRAWSDELERRVVDLKRRGAKINERCSLLDQIDEVERKIFDHSCSKV